jgi:EAL and modified HD-GYP domain-containing signal transduction protein
MGDNKPEELIMLPLIRAHFCESLAPLAGLRRSANDLFLLGLLSAVDAILDMKMQDVVHEIAIGDEIRGALLGEKNKTLRPFAATNPQ